MQPGELFLPRQQHELTAAEVEASQRGKGRHGDSVEGLLLGNCPKK